MCVPSRWTQLSARALNSPASGPIVPVAATRATRLRQAWQMAMLFGHPRVPFADFVRAFAESTEFAVGPPRSKVSLAGRQLTAEWIVAMLQSDCRLGNKLHVDYHSADPAFEVARTVKEAPERREMS
jgi:hypothetical protein